MFERKAKQLHCHFKRNNVAKSFCYWTEVSICKASYRIESSKPTAKRTKGCKYILKKYIRT